MKLRFNPVVWNSFFGRRVVGVVGLLLIFFAPASRADALFPEGYAYLSILHADGKTIVCRQNVSGQNGSDVFALNPATRKEPWRLRGTNYYFSAHLAGGDTLILCGNGLVEKRDLRDGSVLWRTLVGNELPEASARPREVAMDSTARGSARWNQGVSSMYRPNTYEVVLVSQSVNNLLFGRRANSRSGCVVQPVFEDWFLLEQVTGRVIRQGRGGLKGVAGQTAYVEDFDELYFVTPDDIGVVPGATRRGSPSLFLGRDDLKESSVPGAPRCLWECYQGGNPTGIKTFVLIEETGHRTRFVDLEVGEFSVAQMACTRDGLLRYQITVSERPPEGFKRIGSGSYFKSELLIEYLDVEGKPRARNRFHSLPGGTEFAGWTHLEEAVFLTDDRLLLIRVPSLESRAIPLPNAGRSSIGLIQWRTARMFTDSNTALLIDGNRSVSTMPRSTLAHAFVLTKMDLSSGNVIWHHKLPVVMGKAY